jgi:S-DNA-T family DNA segregation ATPase FtsK/SpoIIIE
MTFPLGSLRLDGADRSAAGSIDAAPAWRVQVLLLVGAVAWVLAVIALATHSAADAGFSTTGTGGAVQNKAGLAGALLSDLAYFLVGYSAWWAVLVAARVWLAGLAHLLRASAGSPAPAGPAPRQWPAWLGLALLLAASTSLEWTRLYRWEALVPGGNAGGVLGYTLGKASQAFLGFAGSGVLWIAALVAGVSLGFGFSWLSAAERLGALIESIRLRRVERIEREEDLRLGEEAIREREETAEVAHERHEQHLPIVIEPTLVAVPKSTRVVKERQKPLFPQLDSKLPQVDLLDSAPQRAESVAAETLEMTSRLIEKKLSDFGVDVRVVAASPGPVITRYEIEPAVGVKGAQVVGLAKDLARSLSLVSIRVVETIPGKTTMALELPNA